MLSFAQIYAKLNVYVPTKYIVNGSLRIPTANTSQTFDAAFDLENNLAYVGYYNNMSYTIWNQSVDHVFTEVDHLNCTHIINGQNDTTASITTMLPDYTANWKELDQDVVRGMTCRHFQLHTYDDGEGTKDNKTYVDTMDDYQDFWCIPGEDFEGQEMCTPWQWDIHGYNTNGGSHYDYYSLEYYSFRVNPEFTSSQFAQPAICQNVQSYTNLYGNDLFFTTLQETVVLKDRLEKIAEMRQNKNFTFSVKENKFAKVSHEDFLRMYTGYRKQAKPAEGTTFYKSKDVYVPPQLDWRVAGNGQMVVTVPDQEVCGSCWAHGAKNVLESIVNAQLVKQNVPKVGVSAQEIMSCSWQDDETQAQNLGCNGGEIDQALIQLKKNHGGKIPLESKSPYLGVESVCDESAFTDKYGVIDEVNVIDASQDTATRIQQTKELLQNGPVGVSIAVPESLSFYQSGIYNDPACGYGTDAELVHAVTLIGYGTSSEHGDYWIIKNSWAPSWGQNGYIYISMENDLCGVTTAVVTATLKQKSNEDTQQYHFRGTFSLPYNNITQEIEVHYDEQNKREKIDFFNGTDYSVWNLNSETPFYGVITYLPEGERSSEQICLLDPTLGYSVDEMTPILPDLSANWTKMDNTTIMGQNVYHFRLETIDEPADAPARLTSDESSNTPIFGYTRNDQQDYYCQNMTYLSNGTPICDPIRWEIHGYNTIFGSHYDYYVLDFYQFERDPIFNDSTFDLPKNLTCQHYMETAATSSKWVQVLAELTQHNKPLRQRQLDYISRHNANPNKTFTMAPNAFVGMDFQTFKKRFTGYKAPRKTATLKHQVPNNFPQVDFNGKWFINETTGLNQTFKPIDWRSLQNTNGFVQNQANCGSCWAFGSSAALNGRVNLLLDKRYGADQQRFYQSQQAIVDCVWVKADESNDFSGLNGCDGGFADMTYEQIIDKFGGKLADRRHYPYQAQDMPCKYNNWNYSEVVLRNYSTTTKNSTGELKYALTQGPLTVAITVAEDMMFYSGGIYYSDECYNDEDYIDHQVTLVGWGKSETTGDEYWIIENSWSSMWGMDGYIAISMKNNICGVTLETTIPNVDFE